MRKTLLQAFLFTCVLSVTGIASSVEARPLCVIADRATLREGPGTKFPVSWSVGKNMPLLQVGNKGNWLHVEDLDGQKHWIFSKLVSAKGSCVAVKVKTATLRQGPGSRRPASELPFAERYSAFRKIDRDDAWVKLEDEYGGRFWIHESTIWIPMMRARISY